VSRCGWKFLSGRASLATAAGCALGALAGYEQDERGEAGCGPDGEDPKLSADVMTVEIDS
jgi:hypothetical protein